MNTNCLNRSLQRLILCALCVWSGAHASVTVAQEQPEVQIRSKVVFFGDLNLSNPEGVEALYRRIRAAAHRLCNDRNVRTRQIWSKAERECRRAAVANAVAEFNNDRLTALHREAVQGRHG